MYFLVTVSMTQLCTIIMGKWAEFANGDLGYLAKENTNQSVEVVTWYLLSVHIKMWEGRDKLGNEPISNNFSNLSQQLQ
jgi:hypothetical protein